MRFLSVSVPVVSIQVVSGEPAYLPCDISTKDPHDQVLLVLWYRDLGPPVYRSEDVHLPPACKFNFTISFNPHFMIHANVTH